MSEHTATENLTIQGRQHLAAWEAAQPDNFYTTDQHLQSILEFYWGAEKLNAYAPHLTRFGAECATVIDAAVRNANEPHNLPRLERFNAVGERLENVIHSADHHLAGKHIYGSGAMGVYDEPGNNVLALALFYLSSYNGEAGHNCPLACTAGIIKTLQAVGSDELKAKYLPRLLDTNYDTLFTGAQFLTEVQGGSDVGANACTASPHADGTWRINGEKWFCSNVGADLALMTARPEGANAGTKGLGLFLVPRRLDDGQSDAGLLNGIYIRRLKDKLGTKSMATGEVDFKDCVAYQVGESGTGFQYVMDYVINTSRLYNAMGSAAAARRAYVIAWTYAQHRHAFGQPISQFPLVQETLAEMRCDVMAMTAGSFYLAHLRDRVELGEADDTDKQFFRFVVNLNKYYASLTATNVVRKAIEILGGNGAMENFSVLPRLLRDCVIFETWEGAHNTLLAQAVRDIQKHKMHEGFFNHLATLQTRNAQTGDVQEPLLDAFSLSRNALTPVSERLDELGLSILIKQWAQNMIVNFYALCLTNTSAKNRLSLGGLNEVHRYYQWHRVINRQGISVDTGEVLQWLKAITAAM